jgi:hypothetical protein
MDQVEIDNATKLAKTVDTFFKELKEFYGVEEKAKEETSKTAEEILDMDEKLKES